MSISRKVSEINGDFSRNFIPTPVYLTPLSINGFSLELGIVAWDKKKLERWGCRVKEAAKTALTLSVAR